MVDPLSSIAWLRNRSLVGVAFCAVLLPLLQRMQFRQHAYEDAPQTHQKKSGTPTMGGVLFVLALLPLLALANVPFTLALLAVVALMCRDRARRRSARDSFKGRNRGLRARTKFLASALVAIVFLRWIGFAVRALSARRALSRGDRFR